MKSIWYIAALLMGIGVSCNAYALPANPWAAPAQSASGEAKALPSNPWTTKKALPQVDYTREAPRQQNVNIFQALKMQSAEETDEEKQEEQTIKQQLQELNDAYGPDIRRASQEYRNKFSDGMDAVGDASADYSKRIQKGYKNVTDTTKAYGRKIKDGYDDMVDTAEDYGRKIKNGYNSAVSTAKYYGRQLKSSFRTLENEFSSLKGAF